MKANAIFHAPKFSNRAFFVVFLIVFIAQIVDAIIGTLADILWEFTISFWGVALFFGISTIYAFGQYFILGMVKAKNREREIRKNQFNDEIKYNSINLSTSYWNNIFESIKLLNRYWSKIFNIGIDSSPLVFQKVRLYYT